MPPHSRSLLEEGASFKSFLLVRNGEFREQRLTERLMAPGTVPGSSGTRNLQDNLSDLRAQIAANQKVFLQLLLLKLYLMLLIYSAMYFVFSKGF